MTTEAMILMDTESSGRYFDVRTCDVKAFKSIQALRRLCQSTLLQTAYPENGMYLLQYPAKGKLVSLRISIYAADQAGAHGTLHISPIKCVAFKSSDELERLIGRETRLALKRQRRNANGRRGTR